MHRVLILFCLMFPSAMVAGERTVFADGKLSIELGDGWKKSERNQGSVLAGWESSDQACSIFFQKMNVGRGLGMTEIMDGLVTNFEATEGLVFKKVSEYKTGQVTGVEGKKYPAVFATLEMTLKGKPRDFEMKFYLFVFDIGTTQYFMQGSSTKPVRDVRERQIMEMIRSLVARP